MDSVSVTVCMVIFRNVCRIITKLHKMKSDKRFIGTLRSRIISFLGSLDQSLNGVVVRGGRRLEKIV
jgi:hypothetical protein